LIGAFDANAKGPGAIRALCFVKGADQ